MLSLVSQSCAFSASPVVFRTATPSAASVQMGVADMCAARAIERRLRPPCCLLLFSGGGSRQRAFKPFYSHPFLFLSRLLREGTGPETGGKVFDPMGLSKIASEETLAWYRAAELKHSRVAMAAATGWAYVASGGPLFPGYLSVEQGVTFESLGRDGYAAWDAVPDSGKLQIIGVVGILDLLGEAAVKPHYMMGGTPGKIPLLWDPLGFTASLSPETLARKRTAEIKNG